jgi:hypothetical protein
MNKHNGKGQLYFHLPGKDWFFSVQYSALALSFGHNFYNGLVDFAGFCIFEQIGAGA